MSNRQICLCTGDGVNKHCWIHGEPQPYVYPAKPTAPWVNATPEVHQGCDGCKERDYQIKVLESWFTSAIAHSGCECDTCRLLQRRGDGIVWRISNVPKFTNVVR